MVRITILAITVLGGCGTKQNPQACCTDAVDCMNVGLPVGTTCDDGLLCRGNRCVEKTCAGAGECDITAPYCVMTDEGRCSESCTADAQCPGFSQDDASRFCVAGACVQCRAGMNDCPMDAPICSDAGACVACVAHTDCATGVCADGQCATEDEVAYVATNGSPASDCTMVTPCNTIDRALIVNPPRPYILIESGTYSSTTAVSIDGVRSLIGRGPARPVLTRSAPGPIIRTVGAVDARLEHLELFGATGESGADQGYGIACELGGAPKVELVDILARGNVIGAYGQNCNFHIIDSTFTENTRTGVKLTDSTSELERVTVIGNESGIGLDGGVYVVTNSVIARNTYLGIDIYSVSNGNHIEFNTIVDNGAPGTVDGGGLACNLQGSVVGTFANNIIARNQPLQISANQQCIYPNSIIIDSDLAPLKLVRPDAPPYDYHIGAGSIAIDAATVSTIKTDFDGEARPAGAGYDVGADELH